MSFCLHPDLQSKIPLGRLRICRLLLEPNGHYSWVILVPEVPEASRLLDLSQDQQLLVWQDLQDAQKAIWSLQPLTQLNVGILGNRCPQLHLHVVGRLSNDPAWPGPVWGHPSILPESDAEREQRKEQILQALQSHSAAFFSVSIVER